MRDRQRHPETGIALIAVLLLLMLVAALSAGFAAVVMSENRLQRADNDRTEAFYAAHGAIEKMTSDLGDLFVQTYAPTGAQVTALNTSPPVWPGVTFVTTSEGTGYGVTFAADANGNPVATQRSITTGPFAGFTALITPYTLSAIARANTTGEVRLERQVQTVGIPLFQFGQFSDTDLSFHPGPAFDFGGRVHTNGNLFLAAGTTLTLADKVTAMLEVIRSHIANGAAVSSGWTGNVRVSTSPGVYRNLATTEGSLVNTIGSAQNNPTWPNLSIGTYAGRILNGRTGARRLDLPLVGDGSSPIELIRRPPSTEGITSSLFAQRYFSMASLRILLSDTAADITSLPTVTGTVPIALGNVEPAGYTVNGTRPPFAEAAAGGNYRVPAATGLLGGFIKIEKQTSPNVWQDVTLDILILGITGPNLSLSCPEPNPDAVIRLERIKDLVGCSTGTTVASDYWPKMLYDTREAKRREDEPVGNTPVYLGGVMHYVELDVANLTRWFQGTIGASGTGALNTTGYTVYFSDRRGNRTAAGLETGEYGAEDFVNPASATGAANGVRDTGEDVNQNSVLDVYGQTPGGLAVAWTAPLDNSARPWTSVTPAIAQSNPARFFRRALKVVHGPRGSIISPGLTIAAENPVYLQGDYNAAAGFGNPHVATSIAADAVTLLSNAWTDRISFTYPHNATNRNASNTWYRVAIMAGKGVYFPRPTAGSVPTNFGSDGGTHNFLRFLEDWNARTCYYRGSMASLYYNRQALGVFKDGNNTYNPPTRDYAFDTDFLTPALLPPRTPMFRDVNTLGFTQTLTAPR